MWEIRRKKGRESDGNNLMAERENKIETAFFSFSLSTS
jgi:hypothetical protein